MNLTSTPSLTPSLIFSDPYPQYTQIPASYSEYLASLVLPRKTHPALHMHLLALYFAGWSVADIAQAAGVLPISIQQRIAQYYGQDLSQFTFPQVPSPTPDAMRPLALPIAKSYKSTPHQYKYLTSLPKKSVSHLRRLLAKHRASPRLYSRTLPLSKDPKYKTLAPLAKHLCFYYMLGIDNYELSRRVYDTRHTLTPLTDIRRYYAWPSPSLPRNTPNSFNLIYSPRLSLLTKDMLSLLNPQTLERLSLTPTSTFFGPDLNIQKHLFMRTSTQNLFGDLPDRVTLLTP